MPLFSPDFVSIDGYPEIEPSLKLDFVNARALDPRMSFFRETIATYIGSDGLIKTAGVNEPRFDHDPVTGESLGLLIEESRTNNFTQSNASNWSNAGVTRGTNTAQDVSPEGLNTATIVSESTNNGLHRIKSPNISFSDTRTFSVWIKRNSGTRDLYINANAIMGAGLNFDFDTETLGSTTGTASFERYPNQWYRFVLTGTGTGGTNGVYIQFTQSGNEGDDNYVGVTSNKFLLWGAQLEVGSFVTSHIPTSGAVVTRSVEYAYSDTSEFLNPEEGTIVSRSRWLDWDTPGSFGKVLWSINAPGGFGNGIYVSNEPNTTTTGIFIVDGSATQAFETIAVDNSDGTTPDLIPQFLGVAYKENDVAFSFGFGSVSTDTSATIPDLKTDGRFVIGNNAWGSFTGGSNHLNPANCHIKSFSYYPKRLTNAQLQTLLK